MSLLLSRRSFLRASLLGAACLASGSTAWGRPWEGKLLPGRLNLLHVHTGERQSVLFRDESGEYDLAALDGLNRLLRCHHTGEVRSIDLRTIEYLSLVDRQLGGGKEIHIISAYRSPAYNDLLRREDRMVAKNSYHLLGRAIDLRVPGVNLKTLRRAALELRYGGLGYYPRSEFVHIDSGDFRTW